MNGAKITDANVKVNTAREGPKIRPPDRVFPADRLIDADFMVNKSSISKSEFFVKGMRKSLIRGDSDV
jgi:hypothetical protein